MTKCDAVLILYFLPAGTVTVECELEKDHKGKHKRKGNSDSKLFRIEWWDDLSVIEGLGEMYIGDGGIKE